MGHKRHIVASCVVALVIVAADGAAYAQQFQILYSFTGGTDGALPHGSLIQGPDGTLYGMTLSGPGLDLGPGVLFSFNPSTGTQTTLHVFDLVGDPANGRNPYGSPTLIGNTLYGLTNAGGADGMGAMFSYDLASNTYTNLHSFVGGTDGKQPFGSLLRSGSTLYGGTFTNLFAYNIPSQTYQSLGGPATGFGSPIQSGNTLYGYGALNNNSGLFAFDIPSQTTTYLHSFTGGTADGSGATGTPLKSGNIIYGMTQAGGKFGQGTIFSFDLATNTESILYSFSGGRTDGAGPYGSLIQSGDILYGMTRDGGNPDPIGGTAGTIFAFDLTTDQFLLLHAFAPSSGATPSPIDPTFDGKFPYGDLLVSGKTLYGMSEGGGQYGFGTIFSITLPEPSSGLLVVLGTLGLALRRHRRA